MIDYLDRTHRTALRMGWELGGFSSLIINVSQGWDLHEDTRSCNRDWDNF
uniref:Uncharacterized protein n=1 Tax=Lepeophtheirus salmonis TaxID=72036 RepID=A0A0K2V8S4_LEPSM